jgi:hypothetical protein
MALSPPSMRPRNCSQPGKRPPARQCMSPVCRVEARRRPPCATCGKCNPRHDRCRLRATGGISRVFSSVAVPTHLLRSGGRPNSQHGTAKWDSLPAVQPRISRWQTWTTETATAFFQSSGLEPLEPYPGSASKAWTARHLNCGRTVAPRLGNVAQGQGPCRECGQEATHRALRLEDVIARELMHQAGLEPLSPFPGVDMPWLCRHTTCGKEVTPSYSNIKRGQTGCVHALPRPRQPDCACQRIKPSLCSQRRD